MFTLTYSVHARFWPTLRFTSESVMQSGLEFTLSLMLETLGTFGIVSFLAFLSKVVLQRVCFSGFSLLFFTVSCVRVCSGEVDEVSC